MPADFEITFFSGAVLCVLIFLSGFADATVGGGGLFSLPAYFFIGLPAHYVLGCNKCASSFAMIFAVLRYWKGKTIHMRAALAAAAGSLLGSSIGANIALYLDEHSIKTVLLIVLPLAAAIIFFQRNKADVDRTGEMTQFKLLFLSFFIGFFVGGYDGMIGPGGGTFAILAFSSIGGFDIRTAAGNAKILILASNTAAFVTFAFSGTVIYWIALPAALFGIAGSLIGAHFALAKGARFLRPMMLIMITALFIKLSMELIN